ncbi:MAG TPA: TolC family protein [Lacipirellulaceae bacterium]|nr:TolC family protein [Lacipirellulaceae bacterium]
MNRQTRKFWSLVLIASMLAPGCAPQQPFYCRDNGDLSHYLGVATQIEYPDVQESPTCEINNTLPPLTLKNTDNYQIWDLTLNEAVQITLCRSQVMRQLGGRVVSTAPDTISRTIINPVQVTTTYDPALVDSTTGLSVGDPFNGSGTEAALSEFDARWDSSVFWEKNRLPQNANNFLTPDILAQDSGTFTSGITKTTASGGTFGIRNNTNYVANNISSVFPSASPTGNPGAPQLFSSDWTTNVEATFSQPLFQGAGAQYNRIAGPMSFDQYAAGLGNPIDGVMIARIRTDETLADFEGGVRNLMHDCENAYWELYFAYRDLEARKMGRDSALETWKKTAALYRTGSRGGSADREAEARSQYFLFRSQVEQALTDVFRDENRLRYIMGLSMSDGKLIRPADEPTTARVAFDWAGIHCEALTRRVEIRKEKWEIKRRELELIAARNFLLPRIDAVGRYRWQGLGDELINQNRTAFDNQNSSAFGTLTSGDFQDWQLGIEASIPIGFRKELSGVRHEELLLARERAILQDLELEVSHQLGDSIRDVDLNYGLTQSNFNRRVAAEAEVQAVAASYEANKVTLDLLLDAQRRRAEAESAYYRSLVDYNTSIMTVHYRKGSLLDYDGVYLAEGEWPAKAYFDAMRQARKRDAGLYMDYGYTRPNVLSRGPVQQGCSPDCQSGDASMMEAPGSSPQQVMPPGAVPEETLPGPNSAPQGNSPPMNNRSDARRNVDERQAYYSPRKTPADAGGWARSELGWAGDGLWRRPTYDLSRFGNTTSSWCAGRV